MIRKHLITLVIFMLAYIGYAQPVSHNDAKNKALQFMKNKGMVTNNDISLARVTKVTDQQTPFFVFNSSDGNGFVIVSGDQRTEEILGYSTEGFFDEENMPENLRSWMDSYEMQIAELQKGMTATSPMKVKYHPPVGKMVTSAWDQGTTSDTGDAFNYLCPVIDGEHCLTGCVATAMAQIMRYNRWPESYTATIPQYTPNVDIGSMPSLGKVKFSWNDMLDRYDEGQSDKQKKAVAQLMLYCGQALKMDYGIDGSSAYSSDVPMALRTYFGYDTNTRYVRRSDYSAEGWDELIYGELSKGRPVLYHGASTDVGHSFVCDGYDGKGYYHINWGWNGRANGYFKLSIMNPHGAGSGGGSANSGYTQGQGAVVGIQKPTNNNDEKRTLSLEDFSSEGHTIIAKYANRTGMDGTFDYGLAYRNVNDNSGVYKLKQRTDLYEVFDQRTFSSNVDEWKLADGTYRIYPYNILQNSKWYRVIGDYKQYYEVTFSNGTVTALKKHPVSHLKILSLECVGNGIVDMPQEVSLRVRNDGEEYNKLFYLFASKTNTKGEAVDVVCFPIEEGATEETSLFFTPNETGKWNIWVDIKEDGSNNISPIQVDIKKGPVGKAKLSLLNYQLDAKTDAVVRVSIKNNSTEGYYMPIYCYLFEKSKTYNIAFAKTQSLNIKSNGTAELEFRFDALQMNHEYHARLRYFNYHMSDDMQWLGNGMYFVVNEVADPVPVEEIQIQNNVSGDVYSLSGTLVRKNANSLEGLPKGMYIIGGKKYVVR